VTNLAVQADYGYAAGFATTKSHLSGILWQTPPAVVQGSQTATAFGTGDNAIPTQNIIKYYAIYAIPFSSLQANLQAEAESGTLGTGWSSVADAGASGGNAAKAASGTLSTNADLFGPAWSPPAGIYDVWFRVRVTSIASAVAQMQLGLWNPTTGAFVASTTYAPSQSAVAYGASSWLRVATAVTLPAANATQFRAVTTATLATDWFIDEAVLVPKSGATGAGVPNYPQDLWQQSQWDRIQRIAIS
jgi:hypothetical protein